MEVPEIKLSLSDDDYQQLRDAVDISRSDNDYGVSALHFLINNCPSISDSTQ